MDVLLVCRDALASSLVGSVLWALEARKSGLDVRLLFTGEALAALCRGTFVWPRELMHQDARLAMADNAKAAGMALVLRGEARQLDWHAIFSQAVGSSVPMYADAIWSELLGLHGKLPEGVAELDKAAALGLLNDAKKVVGSF